MGPLMKRFREVQDFGDLLFGKGLDQLMQFLGGCHGRSLAIDHILLQLIEG